MATDRGYPWLKLHTSLLDDLRFMRLSDGARALYLTLYLLAGRADAGGLIVIGEDAASAEDIAYAIRRSLEHVEAQLTELEAAKLLTCAEDGYTISRFAAEQGPSQSERRAEWSERQKRKRAKFKNENLNLIKDLEEEEEGHTRITRESRVTNPSAAASPPSEKMASLSDPADRIWRMIKPSSLVIPPTLRDTVIPVIDAALSRCNHDEAATAAEGKTFFDAWCGTRGKDGKYYSPSGRGWIDWWSEGTIPTNGKAAAPAFQEVYE